MDASVIYLVSGACIGIGGVMLGYVLGTWQSRARMDTITTTEQRLAVERTMLEDGKNQFHQQRIAFVKEAFTASPPAWVDVERARLAEGWRQVARLTRHALDTKVAKTPDELIDLERNHDDAERPRLTPAEPPVWESHPAIVAHRHRGGRVIVDGKTGTLKLIIGPRGDERCVAMLPLDGSGGVPPESSTPQSPMRG